jgi:transcriptional regulator with XRE-family HTH domain
MRSVITSDGTGPIFESHDKNVCMNLAKKIIQLRQERDWSQTDLGKKVGVNQRYVSTWETGRNLPHVETLVKIAQVFEVSVDYLLLDNIPREGVHTIDDLELYEQFQQAEALPADQKKAIKQLVGALIFQHKVKQTQEEIEERTSQKIKQAPLRKVAGKR